MEYLVGQRLAPGLVVAPESIAERLAMLEKMNADNAKMRAVYLDEKTRLALQYDEAIKALDEAHSVERCPYNGYGRCLPCNVLKASRKAKCVCRPMTYQEGLDGNCIKCGKPIEKPLCRCPINTRIATPEGYCTGCKLSVVERE